MGEALTHVPDNEIERIRQVGRSQLAVAKELQKLEKQIAGLTWGTGQQVVHGASFSPGNRAALAEFCHLTRANPVTHVDLLGGKWYLNSNFWTECINQQAGFHHFVQRDISPAIEAGLRKQADEILARAAGETNGRAKQLRDRAHALEDEADEMGTTRRGYSPRETATCVVETIIYRFINAAPLDAIRAGTITDLDPYLVEVKGCNWAGGMGQSLAQQRPPKYDPIGDANPSLTAHTRSLRRAAVKAFSAWLDAYDRQITRAEDIMEAEYEILQDDAAQAQEQRLQPDEQQAVATGAGEPAAARPTNAQPLPAEGETLPTQATVPVVTEKEQFDFKDAHKRLFATLKDAGISEDGRKLWAKDNQLPESTKHWNAAHYDKAFKILVDPTKAIVLEGAKLMGLDIGDLSMRLLGKDRPSFLKDWILLRDELDKLATKSVAPQAGLDL